MLDFSKSAGSGSMARSASSSTPNSLVSDAFSLILTKMVGGCPRNYLNIEVWASWPVDCTRCAINSSRAAGSHRSVVSITAKNRTSCSNSFIATKSAPFMGFSQTAGDTFRVPSVLPLPLVIITYF